MAEADGASDYISWGEITSKKICKDEIALGDICF